ncbi:hypothetical protein AAY473_023728 [Plecturocebus cupreus]
MGKLGYFYARFDEEWSSVEKYGDDRNIEEVYVGGKQVVPFSSSVRETNSMLYGIYVDWSLRKLGQVLDIQELPLTGPVPWLRPIPPKHLLSDRKETINLPASSLHPPPFASCSTIGFHHIGQAVLELLTSGDPPTLASLSAGVTGVSHCARPPWAIFFLYYFILFSIFFNATDDSPVGFLSL